MRLKGLSGLHRASESSWLLASLTVTAVEIENVVVAVDQISQKGVAQDSTTDRSVRITPALTAFPEPQGAVRCL